MRNTEERNFCTKGRRDDFEQIYKQKGEQQVRLIDEILDKENMIPALKAVKQNKGAAGVDNVTVDELETYFRKNWGRIKEEILQKKYKPQPVRRVYIPKANGGKRPLGIPTVGDRTIQQATTRKLTEIYDPTFSEYSHGFRPNRSCHTAMEQVLTYLNEGYDWVIDLDIEKYFDTVNHDKLISILRERVNDATTLHLIRSYLQAGVMENGLESPTEEGVPQGGPLSPILSNVYLDKFDKELESRGLRFVRYADDCNIFVKSEMAADRVMKSVMSWLERKLFLKVSATKTKVVRPSQSEYLGFGFWKGTEGWKCKPLQNRKQRLYQKCREVLIRRRAVATPLGITIGKVNEIVRGWINYYRIGKMKDFLKEFGQWMRHKIRVIILKEWKRPRTIFRNLMALNKMLRGNMRNEDILKVANSRLGWYARSTGNVVNFLLPPKLLQLKKKDRPGLIDPLAYYLSDLQ